MAFINVEDLTGHAELVVFPRDWERVRPVFQNAGQRPLILGAQVERSQKNDQDPGGEGDEQQSAPQEIKLIYREVLPIEEACERCAEPVTIYVPDHKLHVGHLEKLRDIFLRYKGSRAVKLFVRLKDCDCLLGVKNIQGVHPCSPFYKEVHEWQKKKLA